MSTQSFIVAYSFFGEKHISSLAFRLLPLSSYTRSGVQWNRPVFFNVRWIWKGFNLFEMLPIILSTKQQHIIAGNWGAISMNTFTGQWTLRFLTYPIPLCRNPSVCARVEMARLCALVYTTRGGHEQEAEEPVWEERYAAKPQPRPWPTVTTFLVLCHALTICVRRLALAEKFMRLLEEETDKDAIAETVQGEDGRRDMWGRRAYAWLSLVGDEVSEAFTELCEISILSGSW